jgi:hypothetical protein
MAVKPSSVWPAPTGKGHEQRRVIAAYREGDARLAAMVRQLRYGRASGGGGLGSMLGGMPAGMGGGTPSGTGGGGLGGMATSANTNVNQAGEVWGHVVPCSFHPPSLPPPLVRHRHVVLPRC